MALTITPRPIVKWVGGKQQIEDILFDLAPQKFEMYFEPFSGGAAFFLKLVREERITAAMISDINRQLMITYVTVMDRTKEVIALLKGPVFRNTKENYYAVRAWDRDESWNEWMKEKDNWPMVAARVIFLTKLSYNGLWRENSKGQHNAPYCNDESKNILDEINLKAFAKALKKTEIAGADFNYLLDMVINEDLWAQQYMAICPTDFVYFDSPYIDSWSDYSSNGWNMKNMDQLKHLIDVLTERGTYIMMSMKNTPEVKEMFRDYRIIEIQTNCRVNRDASKRKNGMSEVIIMNYDENSVVINQ